MKDDNNLFWFTFFHVSNSALFSTYYFSTLISQRRSLSRLYYNGIKIIVFTSVGLPDLPKGVSDRQADRS